MSCSKQVNIRAIDFGNINYKKSVVAATTTLQNFSLASFWSLPTNLSQHHVLLRQVHKLQCFSCRKAACRIKLDAFPSQVVHPDLVQLQAEQLPQEIAQFWRGTSLPSRNCAILSGSLLGSRIAQSASQLHQKKIAQFSPAGLLSPELHNSGQQSAALPRNCTNLLWAASPAPSQKCTFFPSS
jgi:hypothetical protein